MNSDKELMEKKKEIFEEIKRLKREEYKIKDELLRNRLERCGKVVKKASDDGYFGYLYDLVDKIKNEYDYDVKLVEYAKIMFNCEPVHSGKYCIIFQDDGLFYIYDFASFFEEESKERKLLLDEYPTKRICEFIESWFGEDGEVIL